MRALLLVLLGMLLLACQANTGRSKQGLKQGLRGRVLLREGDHMPGPGKRPARGTEKPVVRELFVYELTNLNQVQGSGPFYTHIQTKLIARVTSRPDGTFELVLKPGKYSLFAKEKEGLFANSLDGEANIYPVEVRPGQVTRVDFVIDYKAAY